MGRVVVLVVVALALAAGILISENKTWRARRAPSGFIGSFELAPIVAGAMPAGAAPRERMLAGGRSSTRFWRREYTEASFVLTAQLDSGEVVPFVRAVRDSIERRLEDAKATVRGVAGENWPNDSLGVGRASGPMALTIPYATRRRVGWVAVRTLRASDDGFTMWVSLFEGPKPSE